MGGRSLLVYGIGSVLGNVPREDISHSTGEMLLSKLEGTGKKTKLNDFSTSTSLFILQSW